MLVIWLAARGCDCSDQIWRSSFRIVLIASPGHNSLANDELLFVSLLHAGLCL